MAIAPCFPCRSPWRHPGIRPSKKPRRNTPAADARAAGIQWTFTPMVDIARDGRWGRIVEGAGEDPYLGSAMAARAGARIPGRLARARQRDRLRQAFRRLWRGRGRARLRLLLHSRRAFPQRLPRHRSTPPQQAGAGSFMSAYMDLNDVPATGNRWLLTDILRKEWGFQGFVVSDAFAVASLETHGFAADSSDAAYKGIQRRRQHGHGQPDLYPQPCQAGEGRQGSRVRNRQGRSPHPGA